MNVSSYIYQSPSSQSVQVGRLDPSAKSDTSSSSFDANTKQTAQDTKSFLATQKSEVTPSVDKGTNIDIYA